VTEQGNIDPALISVNAYSNDPAGYKAKYQSHRLHLPERFHNLLPPCADILDIGCGPGRDLDYFASCGYRVIGVELNPDFVAMCHQRHSVVHADLRNLSKHYSPQMFDGIWAQASLVHLSTDEVASVLADCCALLRDGGLLYLSVPAIGESGWREESDGRRWYTVWPNNTITDVLDAAGFTVFELSQGPYVEVWARKAESHQ